MSTPFEFPSPIGGVPFDADFGPSVLFAVLYAMVCFLGFWRAAYKHTRTVLVITTLIFTIERVVIWSLRAKQAKTPSEDLSRNLTSYWQITFSSGYVAIYGKLAASLKSLVLAALKPTAAPFVLAAQDFESGDADPEASAALLHPQKYAAVPGDEAKEELAPHAEDPAVVRRRARFTRILGLLALQSLVPVVLGLVMGYLYVDAETSASKAAIVRPMRYVIALICLALLLTLLGMSYWASRLPRIRKIPLLLVVVLTGILIIIPLYHLCIMGEQTTSLVSMAPGSGNTPAEKAVFYVFQVVPELITSGTLLAINGKELFCM